MPQRTTDETQDHTPPIRVRIVPSPVMGEVDASIIIPGVPSPPRSRQPAPLKTLPKAPPAPQSGLMSLEGFRDNPDLASCLLFWPPYKHRRLPNALAIGLPTEPYRPDSVHRWPSPWQMTCAGVFSPYSLSPTSQLRLEDLTRKTHRWAEQKELRLVALHERLQKRAQAQLSAAADNQSVLEHPLQVKSSKVKSSQEHPVRTTASPPSLKPRPPHSVPVAGRVDRTVQRRAVTTGSTRVRHLPRLGSRVAGVTFDGVDDRGVVPFPLVHTYPGSPTSSAVQLPHLKPHEPSSPRGRRKKPRRSQASREAQRTRVVTLVQAWVRGWITRREMRKWRRMRLGAGSLIQRFWRGSVARWKVLFALQEAHARKEAAAVALQSVMRVRITAKLAHRLRMGNLTWVVTTIDRNLAAFDEMRCELRHACARSIQKMWRSLGLRRMMAAAAAKVQKAVRRQNNRRARRTSGEAYKAKPKTSQVKSSQAKPNQDLKPRSGSPATKPTSPGPSSKSTSPGPTRPGPTSPPPSMKPTSPPRRKYSK